MEEPEPLAKAPEQPHIGEPVGIPTPLHDGIKSELSGASVSPLDDHWVCVRDPDHLFGTGSLGVVDACKESCCPRVARRQRPLHECTDCIHLGSQVDIGPGHEPHIDMAGLVVA